MSERDEEVPDEIVESIADGVAVNWGTSNEPPRGFRLVERIADAHRALHASDAKQIGLAKTTTCNAPPPRRRAEDAARPPADFREWGPLRIVAVLGEGGFGEVYRAHDAHLDRDVALKLLRPSVEEIDDDRFLEEGRRLAQVRHPNVLVVHGAAKHEGRAGIWTDLVEGINLEECLEKQGTFGAHEASLIGLDVCRAVAAVHGAGLVHRDIKTSNVMREDGGRIVLMDFGLVSPAVAPDASTDGQIQGTPQYMAPEQLKGASPQPTTDTYAIGVLLYRLVTGRYPIEATDLFDLLDKQEKGAQTPLRDARADLPTAFVQVVERALAPEPADRFASAGAMESALLSALGSEGLGTSATPAPPRRETAASRRSLTWVAMAAVLLVAVTLVILQATGAFGPDPSDPHETAKKEPATSSSPGTTPPPGAGDEYRITASWWRAGQVDEPLVAMSRVRERDELFLKFEATEKVYLYVFNADEVGGFYPLFPLSRIRLENPLAPGKTHRVPGDQNWEVTNPGEVEHFLVVASRDPLPELERVIRESEASPGDPSRSVETALRGVRTRGVGRLKPITGPRESGDPRSLVEILDMLPADGVQSEAGLVIRKFELLNPR